MSEEKNIHPPRWAEQLLEWYCKPELLEDLQGDLNEFFERNVQERGIKKAKLIYIVDVLKFFRLYTIRKPEFVNLLINWLMLGSYIKTSSRNIVRNKLFSAINIVGLSISMSIGLLLITVLSDIFSYDKFHNNYSRIYRVNTTYNSLINKNKTELATTSLNVAKAMQKDFPQAEAVAIFNNGFDGDVKLDDKAIPLHGYWANESVFSVFSFHLLQGNPATALKEPYSIVLTQTSAKKIFGTGEALNKTVSLNKAEYTVTGIVEDIPKFSHIHFDMLGSLPTMEIINKDDKGMLAWDNVWGTWVYLLLPNDVDLKNLKTNFDQLSMREDKTVKNVHIELTLQSLQNIMLGPNLSNSIGAESFKTVIWVFGGLAFVVILSACFNYTNLSIARSLRRTREVGVRKVIGALRGDVLSQFIVEAVLISLGSLVIAALLFMLLRPNFLGIEEGLRERFSLQLSPQIIIYFILFAIIVGLAAGFLPAFFFSKINAIQALKDFSSSMGFKKLTMRKVLIVFQYCVSIILITSTVIIYKQYNYFVAFDLGFKTENILNISLEGNKAEVLKKELNELPEVKAISQSLLVTSLGNYWGAYMKYYANPNDSVVVYYNTVDENYLPLHEHKLLAGRNFSAKADSLNETEVIVNQSVLKRLNIANQNPEKAIGEILRVDHKDMQIIGVIPDFQYGKADRKANSNEVIFRYSPKKANWLNVKIESADILATHQKIESIWKKIDTVHPFNATFYDDQIEHSFRELKASIKVAGFIAFLAIVIASLGLLGMVVFTTETRLKEISIRKVLGASEASLLYLLGKGFLLLLIIATFIALPITYLFFDKIVFQELTNHDIITVSDLLVGVAVILMLAIIMICVQTLKATSSNPAEVLKSE